MGFFRRLIGGSGVKEPEPVHRETRLACAGPDALILADPACPLCGVDLDPLPTRAGKRNCPACRETVYVARVDDVGYIIRVDELPPSRAVSDDAEERARDRMLIDKDKGPLRSINRQRLSAWATLGLWVRLEGGGECKTCRSDLGKTYPAQSALLVPRTDCTTRPEQLCFCHYQVTMPPT